MARKPCVHHWLVESSTAAEVPAKCKKCRAKRTFTQTYGMTSHQYANWSVISDPRRPKSRDGILEVETW